MSELGLFCGLVGRSPIGNYKKKKNTKTALYKLVTQRSIEKVIK